MSEVYYGEEEQQLGISPLGMLLVILSALIGLVLFLNPSSTTYDIGVGCFILLGLILAFDPVLVKWRNEGDLPRGLLLALIGATLVSVMITIISVVSFSTVQSEIFLIVALPAITEEPIFRGTVFIRIRRFIGTGPAVVVASGLFALYHFARNPDATYFLILFLGGIIFQIIFILSKNLLSSMLAHAIVNLKPYIMGLLFSPYVLLAVGGALIIVLWRKLRHG